MDYIPRGNSERSDPESARAMTIEAHSQIMICRQKTINFEMQKIIGSSIKYSLFFVFLIFSIYGYIPYVICIIPLILYSLLKGLFCTNNILRKTSIIFQEDLKDFIECGLMIFYYVIPSPPKTIDNSINKENSTNFHNIKENASIGSIVSFKGINSK